jgi:hypothetical protein
MAGNNPGQITSTGASMSLRYCLAATALALCTSGVGAQTIKPGLWEINNKVSGSAEMDQAMARMQQQLASMPPAQRKMMEDNLAKQGMSLPGSVGGGMLVKSCVRRRWPTAASCRFSRMANAPAP